MLLNLPSTPIFHFVAFLQLFPCLLWLFGKYHNYFLWLTSFLVQGWMLSSRTDLGNTKCSSRSLVIGRPCRWSSPSSTSRTCWLFSPPPLTSGACRRCNQFRSASSGPNSSIISVPSRSSPTVDYSSLISTDCLKTLARCKQRWWNRTTSSWSSIERWDSSSIWRGRVWWKTNSRSIICSRRRALISSASFMMSSIKRMLNWGTIFRRERLKSINGVICRRRKWSISNSIKTFYKIKR